MRPLPSAWAQRINLRRCSVNPWGWQPGERVARAVFAFACFIALAALVAGCDYEMESCGNACRATGVKSFVGSRGGCDPTPAKCECFEPTSSGVMGDAAKAAVDVLRAMGAAADGGAR